MYDSTIDTQKHKMEVAGIMNRIIYALVERWAHHDDSKLESPEKECFDQYTSLLSSTTYGSDEYKVTLSKMHPAVDHHNKCNRHHPEHFENGIAGMDLVDIVEMFCDWVAATRRNKDGNIFKSIEISHKRFGFSEDLKSILMNTADRYASDAILGGK